MLVAICDDDETDAKRLRNLLEKYDDEHGIGFIIDEYLSGMDLLKFIRNNKNVDIIFLDINMNGMDGLDVARRIRKEAIDVPIIIVTAFINYAIEGYKVQASRFLVKNELEKTFPECMDDMVRQIQHKQMNMIFSCVEGEVNLRLDHIIYIETNGHKSVIHTNDKKLNLYETMEMLEERLKNKGFLRVHKSYMVNMKHIHKINNYILQLDTGTEIRVPKARYKQVKQDYILYVGRAV